MGIPDSILNNSLEETVFMIFNETGVTVNPRDVEVCHRLNQKTNPEKVMIKLLKRKDVARVMNNKKKLKSMKTQNIGLSSGCKIYINESLCKYYKLCCENVNCCKPVAALDFFGWRIGQ